MRILHILDHSLPIHDGYSVRSRNILECVRNAGFSVQALTSPKHEQYSNGTCANREVIDGITFWRSGSPKNGSVPMAGEMAVMYRIAASARALLKAQPCHLLHIHSPVLNALPLLPIARLARIPILYEIRAFWEDAAVDQGVQREGGPRYRLTRLLESLVCRAVDGIVTISEGLCKDLIDRGIGPRRITVVPNAVNPSDFEWPDPGLRERLGLKDSFVIGFFGSFYEYEGLDTLLYALPRLISQIKKTKVLLVGGGRQERELDRLAEKLGVQEHVVRLGRIPYDRIREYYGVPDVFVFPRKSIRLTELVTPLKPLEAMAAGVPVVASGVGGHLELIGDQETGLLFRAGSTAGLCQVLEQIHSDVELRKRLAAQARRWVREERTWEINGARYSRLYQRLVSKSQHKWGPALSKILKDSDTRPEFMAIRRTDLNFTRAHG